ncbi:MULTISPECIES: lipopolysaccharide biosynthesis protein [unclassified Nitrosospira]|uniref:lipopolysaccharide biosynthesis protein n=1 Tax=unclassified Nitrosospira TaxID=2609267 RepID=UPI000D31C1F3|nr:MULTISPECIES: oligosaccharide flippase family protein [unclassified Nitrosospira]PTR15094.1 O-antigen/teichoic acid export membrane protein [Nitrosospira sp. Nsp2]WON72610.1 oligosaccharide flippase family protein [Nitrosospira sp. Is2]
MGVSPYSRAALSRSATHFLAGKAVSALLTVILLLWLVRLLSTEEYGAYVAFVSAMELMLAITSLGLPWVAARYLPEFRLYASGNKLSQFVWQLVGRLVAFLVAGSLLLFAVMPWALESLELMQHTAAARLYLLVVIMEGTGRNIRDHILGPLLQQGSAQISLVARNLVMLLLISITVLQGPVYLHAVVLIEIAASLFGIFVAIRALTRYLHAHRDLPGKNDWQPDIWRERWRIAFYMYFNHLVTMTYSPQAFVFLIQRYIGIEATALFGFLRSLYTQIANYLPASLLFSLIRPKLIASYVGEGGPGELTRNANLAGKLSLFALMPVLVFVGLVNDELLSLLSGGKFVSGGYYLAGLLLTLIPFSQRHIVETVAVANNMSSLCLWGSALGVLSLPLAYVLVESGLGLWGPIVAMLVGQLIFNTVLIGALVRTTAYRPDMPGFIKLSASALLSFLVIQQMSMQNALPMHGLLKLLLYAALGCGLYLLVSYFLKPFNGDERARLNRLLRRNIFIW